MCTVSECIYTVCTVHTLQVCMFTSAIVVQNPGWGCQSPTTNTRQKHCFKWEFYPLPPTPAKNTVLNGNFVFKGHDNFQEHNTGVKW